MIKQQYSILRRFYFYQKERFPVAVLVVSLFPAILSSGAVVGTHAVLNAVMAVLASLAYLLHIRIIDEHRDFHHDNIHHTNRPVQVGLISQWELGRIDVLAVSILLAVALVSGIPAFGLSVAMLGYSYLAGKEFFLGDKIKEHFFFYNTVNIVQMLLMQLFVYAVFAEAFSFERLILAHFLFTTVGTITFEFIRKVKIPGGDGTGKDTYTWHLGFSNSIVVYLSLVLIDILLFLHMANSVFIQKDQSLIFASFLGIIPMLLAVVHWVKKTRFTDQLLQLSFLLSYGLFNLIIYYTTL